MAGISGAMKWAADHPLILALGVFAVGAVFLLMFRKPVVVQDSGMSAFYAAQAASANSGNELAAVQAQVAGATALATIAGEYNAKITGVRAQTDVALAGLNRDVALSQERTKVEAQNKAYYAGVSQNALQGQALPYLLQALMNPSTSANAAAVMNTWSVRASQFWDANAQQGSTA